MYDKTIVCDIDDTISFTMNRDWENATPNTKLIQKLNKLYDEGWQIEYYTARGTLSFAGDRTAAEKHYRPIIENWFIRNKVKYSYLSFVKPLASYYIDDRAIRPDEFLDLKIEKLSGGLSGANIERRGNLVYKTHPNSLECALWYSEASNIIETVKVHSIVGQTLCMDYIEKTDEPKLEQIQDIFLKFAKVPDSVDFSTYIERVKSHLSGYENDYTEFVIDKLEQYSDFYNDNKSFCHGDLSLDNMINSNGTLYLIDPNRPKGLYSSWLLDYSKILHSARRFDKIHVYEYFSRYNESVTAYALLLLELTHWIRMVKYATDKQYVHEMIQKVLNEL